MLNAGNSVGFLEILLSKFQTEIDKYKLELQQKDNTIKKCHEEIAKLKSDVKKKDAIIEHLISYQHPRS